MTNKVSEGAAPVLQYADRVTQYGVASLRQADLVRVVVPPVRRIRDLGWAYPIGTIILLCFFGISVVPAVTLHEYVAGLINGAICFGGLVLMLLVLIYELRRRIIFEVTAEQFRVTYAGIPGTSRAVWPRAAVEQARIVPSTGKLWLRIRGQDSLEIYLGSDRDANEYVAKTLTDALAAPLVKSDSAETAPEVQTGRRSLPVVAVVISLLMVVAGVILCFYITPCACYLLLLSPVPLGIALGTQNKEYYL
jgi:hypothetical protein